MGICAICNQTSTRDGAIRCGPCQTWVEVVAVNCHIAGMDVTRTDPKSPVGMALRSILAAVEALAAKP